MSQTSITSFFNSRKRPASEDIVTAKNKIRHVDKSLQPIRKSSKTQIKLISKHDAVNTTDAIKKEEFKQPEPPPAQVSTADSGTKTVFSKKINATNVSKSTGPSKSDVVSTARKELNLGKISIGQKLASSSRLAEIKATADRLSKAIPDLISGEKKNLKEFKAIDLEILSSPSKKLRNEFQSPQKTVPVNEQRPLISPRTVFVSPVKSPRKESAYTRHAEPITTSTSLSLPYHYKSLAETFRAMEAVVTLMYNRNEQITFSVIKSSVEKVLKKSFTVKHLAQIKYLVPDFYNFEVKKNKIFSASMHQDTHVLIITPNIPNDIKAMSPSIILERRRYFYDTLLQLAKKYHAQFLLTLEIPIQIEDSKLTRWHPEFEMGKLPEIPCAKLPELPNLSKVSTAQDILTKSRELLKCNTKMERALEKLAQARAHELTDQGKTANGLDEKKTQNSSTQTTDNTVKPTKSVGTSTSNVILLNPALRNLPAALLEKVKAKEAAKALEAMMRTSEDEKKYVVYSRLPELARTLRNIFVTERKNVLALNVILSKLDSSFRSNIPASDLQRDIKVLCEEMPDFVKLYDIRQTNYLKLDKNADLNNVVAKLEALASKYKNE